MKESGEDYISQFPKLKKWINECALCHKKGYNPSLPDQISVVDGAQDVFYIKKYFKPLKINEDGLCDVCEQLMNRKR